jgi:hypothetical protein
MVFVEHEGVASLGLGLENGVPQLLGLDGLTATALTFILLIQSLEFVTVAVGQARALVRTHESPLAVLLNPLHEEIRDPKSEEEITGTDLFLSVVLAKVEEFKDIGVPGLEIDGKGTRTFVATLIDVSGSVIEDTEHGDDTVGGAVGASDIGSSGPDTVYVEANASSHLGDHGAGLEGVVDALNTVILHVHEEARGQLALRSACIEEGG